MLSFGVVLHPDLHGPARQYFFLLNSGMSLGRMHLGSPVQVGGAFFPVSRLGEASANRQIEIRIGSILELLELEDDLLNQDSMPRDSRVEDELLLARDSAKDGRGGAGRRGGKSGGGDKGKGKGKKKKKKKKKKKASPRK